MTATRALAAAVFLITSATAQLGGIDLSNLRNLQGLEDAHGLDMRRLGIPQVEEEIVSQSPLDIAGFISDFPVIDSLYVIGPGDQFQIYLESSTLDKQVNVEGNIIVAKIGVIPVAGLTLKEARQRILERVQAKKIKSQCFVNLGRPKNMRIFITGAVNAPGAYQVNGFFRLTDAITLAQGLAPMAQKSAIRMTDASGRAVDFDIKKFLLQGDLASNPYLTQGAIINVPFLDFAKPHVKVRRDTLFVPVQLDPEDGIAEILFKVNGFRPPGVFSSLLIREKDGREARMGFSEALGYKPSDGSYIEVFPVKREVYVGGAVQRPGFFPFRSNQNALQYLSEAGLLPSSRITKRLTVYREDGSQPEVEADKNDLKPGDMIFVGHNAEQKFIIYTPILLSLASIGLALVQIYRN